MLTPDRTYGRASTERFQLINATSGNFQDGTLVLASGDAMVSIDGAAPNPATNSPAYNSTSGEWEWNATVGERSGKEIILLVKNAAIFDREVKTYTKDDARSQKPKEGQFHSSALVAVTANGATLVSAPPVIPDATLSVQYFDATDRPLGSTYLATLSGTNVVHDPVLAAPPAGANIAHFFYDTKEVPLNQLAIGSVGAVTAPVTTTKDVAIDTINTNVAALPNAAAIAAAVWAATTRTVSQGVDLTAGALTAIKSAIEAAPGLLATLAARLTQAISDKLALLDVNSSGFVSAANATSSGLTTTQDTLLTQAAGNAATLEQRVTQAAIDHILSLALGGDGSVTVGGLSAAGSAGVTAAAAAASIVLTVAERQAIADALLDRANAIATNLSLRGAMRAMLVTAGVSGKVSGIDASTGNNTIIFRSTLDNADAVTLIADRFGNRLSVTLNTAVLADATKW